MITATLAAALVALFLGSCFTFMFLVTAIKDGLLSNAKANITVFAGLFQWGVMVPLIIMLVRL